MISQQEAAAILLARRRARKQLLAYIKYTNPNYIDTFFSELVCASLDGFIQDVKAGKRPILVLQAPPQHGKTEIASRKLPAFLAGYNPAWRIAAATYADGLATAISQDVRRNIASLQHRALFPAAIVKDKFDVNRMGEFSIPGSKGGSYLAVGIGAGLTGRPVDIGIIDDPTKNEEEALSAVTKERHWNWYQTVFSTRLSQNSGQIIMATSWAEDDLPGRIISEYRGNPRFTHLRFPAINEPTETGYQSLLPTGPLVPQLHSLEKLLEQKQLLSDYWWGAMYQQSPKALGGNVFKEFGIQHYLPKDLPRKFEKVIGSWDCTFKDTDGTDFVVGQAWGKLGANAYLLGQIRGRLSFSNTVAAVIALKNQFPAMGRILIEDKANGPAVIDTLKKSVPGLLPIEPDGSKLARAHAITSFWEAHNVWIPHPDSASPDIIGKTSGKQWVEQFESEVTTFPAAAHDDQVDSMSQALRHLFPLTGRLVISQAMLDRAMGRA